MYVGIDVGTSMVKAAAFDGTGREQAVEARPVRGRQGTVDALGHTGIVRSRACGP
jgi:sugar (pentulose or hexulose) kinase